MSEWKPGDVAAWEAYGNELIALRVSSCYYQHGTGDHWHLSNGGWSEYDDHIRSLVVLDPEDFQQLRQVVQGMEVHRPGELIDPTVEKLQAALRELANPTPPIEEPTARFAVVLDRNDDEWCHVGEGVWRSLTSTGQFMVEKHWRDTTSPLAGNVVRVLSEGVVPS